MNKGTMHAVELHSDLFYGKKSMYKNICTVHMYKTTGQISRGGIVNATVQSQLTHSHNSTSGTIN
jgi:hypothetical protein